MVWLGTVKIFFKSLNLTTRQNTSLNLVRFFLSQSVSLFCIGQSPSLENKSQSLRLRPDYSHTVWDSEILILWWLSNSVWKWYFDICFFGHEMPLTLTASLVSLIVHPVVYVCVHHNPAQKGEIPKKRDMYHVHHVFSTYFETHISWALAYSAHQTPHSAAPMYAVPHPLTHPNTYHDCGLQNLSNLFWKIDSWNIKICGTKELYILYVLPDDIFRTKSILTCTSMLNVQKRWNKPETQVHM